LTLHDLKFDLIAFLQALIALGLDGAVVDKYIWSTFLTNESKTLSIVKPLHSAFNSRRLHTFPIFPSGAEQQVPGPELPDHPWGLHKETYFTRPK